MHGLFEALQNRYLVVVASLLVTFSAAPAHHEIASMMTDCLRGIARTAEYMAGLAGLAPVVRMMVAWMEFLVWA